MFNGFFGWNNSTKPFGWTNKKSPVKKEEEKILNTQSIIAVDADEPSQIIDSLQTNFSTFNLVDSFQNQAQLIQEWRAMSEDHNVDSGLADILDAMVSVDELDPPIQLDLENIDINESIKDKMEVEFDYLLKLLNFNQTAYEKARNWYVDGRLIYHCIIDTDNPRKGILKLSNLDPRTIRRVLEIERKVDSESRIETIANQKRYYIYNPLFANETGSANNTNSNQVKSSSVKPGQTLILSDDSVVFCHSGIVSASTGMVLSNLEKARKPLNNLRMVEDAAIIYRITRAGQKRIFYVDVGTLPPKQAEEYVQKVMTNYRTKISYDTSTGTVKGTPHQVSMLEDYFLPRRDGSRGTEIGTLDGGQNIGQMDELLYFQRRLYESLNIPRSRLDGDNGAIVLGGVGADISRDEWKFNKFIGRLRRRFSMLFTELLKRQLILKNITTETDWEEIIVPNLKYVFASDTFMKQQRENDTRMATLSVLDAMEPYVGIYFSREEIQRDILKRSDEEMKQIRKQIDKEKKDNKLVDPIEKQKLEMEPQTDFDTPNKLLQSQTSVGKD